MHITIADYEVNPDIFLIKTEAQGGNWLLEKVQVGLEDDHFIFALKAQMEGQVCLLYDPGYLGGDGGWCVTIGL